MYLDGCFYLQYNSKNMICLGLLDEAIDVLAKYQDKFDHTVVKRLLSQIIQN